MLLVIALVCQIRCIRLVKIIRYVVKLIPFSSLVCLTGECELLVRLLSSFHHCVLHLVSLSSSLSPELFACLFHSVSICTLGTLHSKITGVKRTPTVSNLTPANVYVSTL